VVSTGCVEEEQQWFQYRSLRNAAGQITMRCNDVLVTNDVVDKFAFV